MQVKKNGMKLMKDTASLANALIESTGLQESIKPGDTFCQLHWTDRTLWVVTRVISDMEFFAARVKTKMDNWTEGTEYPELDEQGRMQYYEDDECYFRFHYKNWKYYQVGFLKAFFGGAMDEKFFTDTGKLGDDIQNAVLKFCRTKRPARIHLSFSEHCGYRDPSF